MKYVTLIVLAMLVAAQSPAQSYKWLKGGGSTTPEGLLHEFGEHVHSMCTDPNGNAYALCVIGNLGPIIADTFHMPAGYGPFDNIFVCSYNCSGQMRWAKYIGSTWSGCDPYGIACDTMGHVYVAAYVTNDTLHIGHDADITTGVYQNMAVMQFDTLGSFGWIKYLGDNVPASATSVYWTGSYIALDRENNIHLIASLKYGMPLTPSLISHYGVYDATFDVVGNLTDVRRIELDSTLAIEAITIDRHDDHLYVVGQRNISISSDPACNYIAAFNSARGMIWIDSLRNPVMPGDGAFAGLQADGSGNIYVAGAVDIKGIYKTDTIKNRIPGGATVSFIMRIDTSGNLKWKKEISNSSSLADVSSLTLLGKNKVAVSGVMAYTVTCDYDTIAVYPGEGQNPFFVIIDTAGYLFTMRELHGDGFYDAATALTGDKKGNLTIGGYVESSVWAGTLTPYTSIYPNDYFLMRYGGNCGCTSTPTASFTAVGIHTVNFTYTGTTAGLDSLRWYFGDGSTSTVTNPTHVYTSSGTFDASVRIYSSCGGDVAGKHIEIPCPYTPVASFTMSGSVFSKSFTYTGTLTGVDSVKWRFGDGATSLLLNPTHNYGAPAIYTACVSTYTWCAWDSTCVTFAVPCTYAPVASFVTAGGSPSKHFYYTGTTVATDSIRWDFGDGTTSTLTSPTHTYASTGSFNVCAYYYNPCGSDTICHTVNIPCLNAPTADFTIVGADNSRTFTYTGTTGIDSVSWRFGDGSRTSGFSASHAYTSIATFNVCAIAYSACGNDTICYSVSITCLPPVATFTHFTTHDSTGHFVYSGTGVTDSVKWSFGDGGSATGDTAKHHYATTGVYTVCAVAYSSCGSDTLCDTIKIYHSVGVDGMATQDIIIRPNPIHDALMIDNANGCTALLTDITGRLMRQEYISSASATVDCSGLLPGVYILKVIADDGEVRVFRVVRE